MSIGRRRNLLSAGLLAGALTASASGQETFQPLKHPEAAVACVECGLIPHASKLKSSVDLRKRTCRRCKQELLQRPEVS